MSSYIISGRLKPKLGSKPAFIYQVDWIDLSSSVTWLSILWNLLIDCRSIRIRLSHFMWIKFPSSIFLPLKYCHQSSDTFLIACSSLSLWHSLIHAHSYSTYLHKHSAKTQWKGNDKMKQKGLNTCTCSCMPTHTHTQTHITLHGFNCFCVCNYGSAGSRTEHLGALQWNTLWMNSLC